MTRTAHRARRPPNELIGRAPRAVPLPHAPLERGSVTAEFATVLPAVMVVIGVYGLSLIVIDVLRGGLTSHEERMEQ